MKSFIIGIIIVALGALVTWKSDWILSNFGKSPWAEKNIGGGSRTFYKLMGIIIIFLGFFILSGITKLLLEGFMNMLQMGR